ncbi:LytR/AlgR family response regulator transcription factor [Terrimonas rubra]|uniref:LytR/AlgR family response regulator transcription factor n=1 Tax=Terrimonas rubra TaxID=1035890 RepID=A0ABW6A6I4_9BACT
MLTAIIIDDEPDNVKLLALQLKKYCPEVLLLATCTDSAGGLTAIKEHDPDLLFLDIEMPGMNGFELLEQLGNFSFQVIFVTAYDQFAVKAFKFSALDYLLKPIDAHELKAAVAKATANPKINKQQLQLLQKELSPGAKVLPQKIALPYQNGVVFTDLGNILYCEARDNYTMFYLADGKQHLAAKTLLSVQEILEERNFLRVHRQYLVNLDHIHKYVKGENAYLVMQNQVNIPVARNQKERLAERFGWL